MVGRPERPRVLHRVGRHVVALLPDVHPSAIGVIQIIYIPHIACKKTVNADNALLQTVYKYVEATLH